MPWRVGPGVGHGAVEDLRAARRRRARGARARAWRRAAGAGRVSCTGMVMRERRGTTTACSASGSCTPVSVRNVTSTMASSPKGLNSARSCCAPVDGGARREVPVGARRCACTARPRGRRRARARATPTAGPPTASTTTPGSGVSRMSATRTRVSSPGASRSCSDTGVGVTTGHHGDRDVDAGAGEAGDDHRLVGAAVGLRRAFRAVPRARRRVGRRDARPGSAPRPRPRSDSTSTTSSRSAGRRPRRPPPRSRRRGSGPRRTLRARRARRRARESRSVSVTPAPTRRLLVEDVGQRVVALGAFTTLTSRRPRADAGSRRTRVRRHRHTTRSQSTSAPPSIAQRCHCAS